MEKREKRITGKNRVYTGQLITSETYNNFNSDQRNFWNKAHRNFRKGNMYFEHNGMKHVVPFKFADDSFDTVLTTEKLNKNFKEAGEIKNKIKQDSEQVTGTTDGGQGEPIDRLASNIE